MTRTTPTTLLGLVLNRGSDPDEADVFDDGVALAIHQDLPGIIKGVSFTQ
jgi:hypothetical protein